MNKLTLQSPAKVNLHLRILGLRKDGYHELETLFHRISLCDTLTLSKRGADFSFSSNADLPPLEGNLLFKAYEALRGQLPGLKGVHARLIKRIPIGAGLGGGSGNAAVFLRGMKKLYGLKISDAALMKIGARVGADVPFFMTGKTQAAAGGIGEKMRILPARRKLWFLLIPSAHSLSTPLVYKTYDTLKRPRFSEARAKKEIRQIAGFWNTRKEREAAAIQKNDLEQAAFSLRPDIKKTLSVLKTKTAAFVMMSGSGPTVFAVSAQVSVIRRLKKDLPAALRKKALICHSY